MNTYDSPGQPSAASSSLCTTVTARLALLAASLGAAGVTMAGAVAQTPIVILANGAIPNDGLDDTAAIAYAITLASPPNADSAATKIITLQPGVYDLHYSALPFQLNGLEHVHFSGNGAEFLVHGFDPSVAFSGRIMFSLNGTRDIVFNNLAMDMDRLSYTSGTVVAKTSSPSGNSIDVDFDPAITDLGAQTKLYRIDSSDVLFEPTGPTRLVSGNVTAFAESAQYTTTVLHATSPIRLRFTATPGTNLNFGFGLFQPPQPVVVMHQKYVGNVIHADHCDGLHINGVTAYAAPGMFLYALHSRDISVDNLQLRARTGRLLSISADGLHLHNCTGTFSFTNSYCERMGDDAVNVHGSYLKVTSVITATRFGVSYPGASGWGAELAAGDTVEFWTSDLRKRSSLSVVSFVPPSTDNTIAGELKTSKQPVGSLGPIQIGDVLESPNQACPSSTTIDNVEVYGNLGRSFLIQTRNPVVVRSCHLVRNTGPAIRVTTDNFNFHESIGANNVLIDDCTIERSNWGITAKEDPASICIHAFYGQTWPPSYPPSGVIRNVTISNCTIKDVPFAALHCTSAKDIVFDTNTLDHVATVISLPQSTYVRILNTDTIHVTNNTATTILPPSFPRVLVLGGSQNVTDSMNNW